MTVSFSCEECGKDYQVDDGLAGKRGRCKQCGHTMKIPAAEAVAVKSASPAGALKSFGAGAAAPARPARRPTPAPSKEPESDDPYGLADAEPEPVAEMLAPLPPSARRPSKFQAEPSVAEKPKKKKKKGGFFASKSGKDKGGSKAAGASIGGVIAVVLVVLRLAAAGGNFFGLSSQSEIESYVQKDLAAANEMMTVLAPVHDEPTARAATPRLSAILDRIIADARKIQGKKGRMTDINAVKQKYEATQQAAWQRVVSEIQRVGSIPGGADAIRSLQPKFEEMAAIAGQADGNARSGPNL